jgi:cytochrome c-type biogenesis protein CcmH/NrfG
MMGQAYLQMNDPISALDSFRRALRLNPNMEEVRAQVIHLQRRLKDKS